MTAQGLHPVHMPMAVDIRPGGACLRTRTCDGFPCPHDAKGDAEVPSDPAGAAAARRSGCSPAPSCSRLHTSADGRRVVAAAAERDGRPLQIRARKFVVAAGAVNSAALLLRSTSDRHPRGPRQLLRPGRPQLHGAQQHLLHGGRPAPAQPGRASRRPSASATGTCPGRTIPTRSATCRCWARSRGRWSSRPRRGCRRRCSTGRRAAASTSTSPPRTCPIRTTGSSSAATGASPCTGHRTTWPRTRNWCGGCDGSCGGPATPSSSPSAWASRPTRTNAAPPSWVSDPALSVLDPLCRAHDVPNLWVVDSACFPSSAALNPALTIAANALRVAAESDLDQLERNGVINQCEKFPY